jgi:hypothetical protein
MRCEGWRFVVTPRADEDIDEAPHPDLATLSVRFVSPKNREFTWKTVPFAARKHDSVVEKSAFLKDFFGLDYMHKISEHPLLGRGFRREWLDSKGRHRGIDGIITECFLCNEEELFTVRLEKSAVDQMNAEDARQRTDLHLCKISHRDALGGSACFQRCYSLQSTDGVVGESPVWSVPYNVFDAASCLPSRTLSHRGWRLTLHVAASQIDHQSANLGCFVTCDSTSPHTEHVTCMVIPRCEFIDLGVYARPEDLVPHQFFKCKNFVHSHMAQYSFGRRDQGDVDSLFDINDHVLTAQLNDAARRNVLPFINETDGKEQPCVIAEHDPTGQVRPPAVLEVWSSI